MIDFVSKKQMVCPASKRHDKSGSNYYVLEKIDVVSGFSEGRRRT